MAFRHMLKHSNDNYKGIHICSLLVKMTKSFYLSAPRITELTLLIRYGSNEHSHSSQAPIKIFTGWKYLSISVCQTVVNFHYTTIIWSSNKITHTHNIYCIWSRINSNSNWCHQLQVDVVFFDTYVQIHMWWSDVTIENTLEQNLSNKHISQVWKPEWYHTAIGYTTIMTVYSWCFNCK